mmetsp:Transcript_13465/g.42524  ORF Transcript_13465/g.42524 Transcript_13465/m.42524 type:complete len:460 (+) Transcript_13465:27-1406(+)
MAACINPIQSEIEQEMELGGWTREEELMRSETGGEDTCRWERGESQDEAKDGFVAVPTREGEGAAKRASRVERVGLWVGIGGYAAITVASAVAERGHASRPAAAGACAFVVVVWWLSGAVPMAVSGLMPAALMPLGGAADARTVSAAYMSDAMLLLFSSLLLAKAVERHELHGKLAAALLRRSDQARGVIGAVIACSFVLSMWVSNTAAATMMAPLAAAATRTASVEVKRACGLAVAFGASLGGMATLTGTGPNVVVANVSDVTFAEWFALAAPFAASLALALWRLAASRLPKERLEVSIKAALPWTRDRTLVAVVLLATATLWLTRRAVWARFCPRPDFVTDATVAVAAALVLFVAGALPWAVVADLDWSVFFLVSGGSALAVGVDESGLGAVVSSRLARLPGGDTAQLAAAVAAALSLSNLVSNAAAANILLPLLACSTSRPRRLLPPAALGTSLYR